MSADDRFSRDLVDRQADIFRLYVGPGRRFSWGALSDATATSQSTLKSYANGVQMPLHVALRLIAVLPPEAGNMLIESCGYRLAPIDADADDWAGVGAEASMLTFEIFEAEQDGRIDHVEREKLRRRGRSLIAKVEGML